MTPAPSDPADRGLDIERPWRTGRLPPLVGVSAVAEILGVYEKTIYLWMKPGTGPFGPDGTRIMEPRRMAAQDDDGEWQDTGWPVWAESDIHELATMELRAAPPAAAMARRPWRTSRLPRLVSAVGAYPFLDITRITLRRWMAPGSGKPGAAFGSQQTRICPWAEGKGLKGPVWVLEDLERFAVERGRQRALQSHHIARREARREQ